MLRSVLLLHRAPAGDHYDWLIAPPPTPDDPLPALWAARVDRPWDDWAALGRITLTPLPPHRRRYLTWEGRLDPGPDGSPRGSVTRHATATVAPLIWSPHRLLLDLHTPHQTLRIDLTLPPGPPGSPGEPRAWATVTDLDSRAARGSGTGT